MARSPINTAVADGMQSVPGRLPAESTPRAFAGGPPSLSLAAGNESSPSPDDHDPPPRPGLQGLKLSPLGSYDPGRSPLVCESVQSRSTRLGIPRVEAISPAGSSGSCSAENESKTPFSFAETPGGWAGDERRLLEAAKLPSCCSGSCSSSPSPSTLSSPADKLLRLPRGKSFRFFIDGEEGASSEMKI